MELKKGKINQRDKKMTFDLPKLKTLGTEKLIQTPLVQYLLGVCQTQYEEIEKLKAEIRLLKGHPKKPAIKPSTLEDIKKEETLKDGEKRAGSDKREKTKELKIDEEKIIEAEGVQKDWVFKGYHDYVVQEAKIESHNIKYRLKKYITPEGEYVTAGVPKELNGSHFGPTLLKFILYQYYDCHVTQPILLEQLREMGVDISSGELSYLLTEKKDVFHQEKESLLTKGLEVSPYIQSDDTGARHDGKNGYCTVICNDLFTYFKSGDTKSRINFLEMLRTPEHEDYYINFFALLYMEQQKLPIKYKVLLEYESPSVYLNKISFKKHLHALGASYAAMIVTE